MNSSPEHLDVLIVGVGQSGIGAARYLQARCPRLSYAIFEARDASWTLKCDLTCNYVCRLLNRMRATGMRQCTPVNRDGSVSTQPLLGLTSGYMQRSAHRFPKQGSRFPWGVHQSYLRDYRALRLRGIKDQAMVFSNQGWTGQRRARLPAQAARRCPVRSLLGLAVLSPRAGGAPRPGAGLGAAERCGDLTLHHLAG